MQSVLLILSSVATLAVAIVELWTKLNMTDDPPLLHQKNRSINI